MFKPFMRIFKPRQPQSMEHKSPSNETDCSTSRQDVAPTENIESNDPNENIEENNNGWGKIIFAILKLLLLGISMYCYDVISKSIPFSNLTNYLQNHKLPFIYIDDDILIFSFIFVADITTAHTYIDQKDYVWGGTIISLMFLPNIVFMIWVWNGNRRKASRTETLAKVITAGLVQVVTIVKYVL